QCEYPGCPAESDVYYEMQYKGKTIKVCEGCIKKIRGINMEFLKLFMLKYALQTPWWLYIGAFILTISCVWERGRKERKQIAIVMFFVGTVIMAIPGMA
ncbi:unnamed protein product, partial [marine sediment metagenome]